MTNHPDDPRTGGDSLARERERAAYEACYDEAERFIRQTIRAHQQITLAAVTTAAILERAGVCTGYGDILKDEYLAILAMDAAGVAHDVADGVAQNMDTGYADDLLAVAAAAQAEAAALMEGKG